MTLAQPSPALPCPARPPTRLPTSVCLHFLTCHCHLHLFSHHYAPSLSSKLLHTPSRSLRCPLHRAHPPLSCIRIPHPWGECATRFWIPRPSHGSHESCERLRYVFHYTMISLCALSPSSTLSFTSFRSSTSPPLLSLSPHLSLPFNLVFSHLSLPTLRQVTLSLLSLAFSRATSPLPLLIQP